METMTPSSYTQATLGAIAPVLGLILVLFGLWALGGAIYIAWGLFEEPNGIAYFAQYFFETTKITAHLPNAGEGTAHLIAWFVVILLLLVLGKLGDWAISAGARLLKRSSD
jgi:ABC-type Na+ efflux pump permease subunit